MTVSSELATEIVGFVESVVRAMGLDLTVTSQVSDEGLEINLDGDDGGLFPRKLRLPPCPGGDHPLSICVYGSRGGAAR